MFLGCRTSEKLWDVIHGSKKKKHDYLWQKKCLRVFVVMERFKATGQ